MALTAGLQLFQRKKIIKAIITEDHKSAIAVTAQTCGFFFNSNHLFDERIQRGRQGVLKNHINIGFLYNTGPDSLVNHKATKPAFNVLPSSPRQQNAIDGPFIAVFVSSIPLSTKK